MSYSPDPVADAELSPLASDVLYEYEMLRSCTQALLALGGTPADQGALRNVFVESLNIHARNLAHFFRTPQAAVWGDDLVAQHYAAAWDPQAHGGVDLLTLDQAVVPSIHKRIAHITAYRVRVPQERDAFPVFEICSAVIGLMERFLDLLPTERRAWFEREGVAPDLSVPVPSRWLRS